MTQFTVVLVEPKVEGNVGAIARSMANFGFEDLILVNPPPLHDEAYRRAKHGRRILEAAGTSGTMEESLQTADLVVGTTGIPTQSEKSFRRQALMPWELASKMMDVKGRVALLFGREDYGLYDKELDRVDLLVNIPCDPQYAVLNVSHAAVIILYELFKSSALPEVPRRRLASGFEKENLMEAFRELLDATRYPGHKRRRTEVMFRRLMGRSTPSKWEFHAFMGVLRGASKTIRRLSESRGTGPSS